jgi:hypothetical protein
MPGVGAMVGSDYEFGGGGLRESAGVYISTAGMGVAASPVGWSVGLTLSSPAQPGFSEVACQPAFTGFTPIAAVSGTIDEKTHSFSLTFSVGLSLAIGFSAGQYCGFTHR